MTTTTMDTSIFADYSFHSPFGTIKMQKQLASGSYGTVWTASSIENAYAVKVLFKHGLDAKQLMIQAMEYELHAKVSSHENIVSLLHVHETEEHLFLLLDLYPDGDLFDALVDNSVFQTRQASLEAFSQICRAIQHCHSNGIAHRDLKPENILLSRDPCTGDYSLAVSDFGLAIDAELSTEFGCGSVRYESPECLTPSSPTYPTRASDVWSLGVILINMLAGKNPWCEPILSDEMYREYAMDDGLFFENHFGFDKDVENVLKGCLERNVSKRWGIEELCEAVEGLIDGPDSAIESYGSFRERVNSWASEEMDFSDVPVFEMEFNEESAPKSIIAPIEDEVEKEDHDEAAKGKRRKRRHRKHKGKHVDDLEAEGMMITMAAAFTKMLAPQCEKGGAEDLGEGPSLLGFRMTFL